MTNIWQHPYTDPYHPANIDNFPPLRRYITTKNGIKLWKEYKPFLADRDLRPRNKRIKND